MPRTLYILIILLLPCFINAQHILLPYLSGGFYGLADANGKLVVPVQYQDIQLFPSLGMITVKKENLCGVLNYQGKEIIKPSMSTCEINFAQSHYKDQAHILDSRLSRVQDKNKTMYFINGFSLLNEYVPYSPSDRMEYRSTGVSMPPQGIIHTVVPMPGKKANVIDSTGRKLFPHDVDYVFFVTKDLMGVDTGSGKFALFNTQAKQLTDFAYKYLIPSPNPDYIIAENKAVNGSDYYHLFDSKGKLILSNKSRISAIDDELIIVNDSISGGLYKYNGQSIATFQGRKVNRVWHTNKDYFLLEHPSRKVGVINREGKLVVDTVTYTKISGAPDQHFYFTRNERSGRMDAHFKELWSIDSVSVTPIESIPQFFKLDKRIGYSYRRGIADSLGHIVAQPIYTNVEVHPRDSVMLARLDNKVAVLDLKGKEIIPFTSKEIRLQLYFNDVIILSEGDTSWWYDRQGKFIRTSPFEKPSVEHLNRKDEPKMLFDKNGVEIPKSNYRQIFSNLDEKGKQLVYIGRPKDKAAHFNHVFNSAGKNITPEGYGLAENITTMHTGMNGAVIMWNIQETLQRNPKARSGVINLKGEWIVEPDFQAITLVGNELIMVKNFTKNKTTLYNRYGQSILNKSYHILDNDQRDEILYDRILVGYIDEYDAYIGKLEDAYAESDLMRAAEKLGKIKDPKGRRGFIDSNGKEVIEVKYAYADLFSHVYTAVSGFDEQQKPYAHIIDLNGKVLLSTPYERLKIQNADSTMVAFRENGKWGMMDIQGNVLIDPAYKSIEMNYKGPVIAHDSIDGYVIINKQVTRLDHWGYADIEELGPDLYHIRIVEEDNTGYKYTSYHYVFNRNGKYYGDITTHLPDATARISAENLPPGYVQIHPGLRKPYYIMQLETRKVFRD